MPPHLGPGQQAPPRHQKIIRVVPVQAIQTQQHVLQIVQQTLVVGRGDDAAGAALRRSLFPGSLMLAGPYGLGALIQQQQYRLRQIEGAGLGIGGDGHQPLAMLDGIIIQPPILRAKHDGYLFSPLQGLGHFSRGLLGGKQGTPPATCPGRRPDDQRAIRHGSRHVRQDLDVIQHALSFGSGQRTGFFPVPALRRHQTDAVAAHIHTGAGSHADILGKARLNQNNL